MPSNQSQRLQLDPLTPHLGARVTGIEINDAISDRIITAIKSALDQHLVLIFDNQSLEASTLRNFVARFGPVFDHHSDEGVIRDETTPEVLKMLKEPDGSRLFGGGDWHADVTFRNPGAYVSVLHAVELPPVGGDTLFASAIAAFAGLSPGMQRMLRNLSAVHSYNGRGRDDHPQQTATHPVVRVHPVQQKEGLFINRMFATRFEGLESHESEPIIDFLDRHVSQPEYTARHRWEPGQVVMWDNRFTLHYPSNDFVGHRRLMLRCTAMETHT